MKARISSNLSLNPLQFSCMMMKDKEVESMLVGVAEQSTWAVVDGKIPVNTFVVIKGLLPIVDKVLLILDVVCEMLLLTIVGGTLAS